MRPVRRYGTNKRASAKRFRSHTKRTRALNMRATPMRGGFRI